MTNDEIEAFLTTVETGTITDAAQKLGVTQPALSRRISTLEGELGFPLFERTRGKRTVAITREGSSFIYIAQRYRSVMMDCQAGGDALFESHLHISAIESFADIVLPHAIAGFAERHPYCQLSVRKCTSSRGIRAVQDDECDMAIVARGLDSGNTMSEILFEDPYYLVSQKPVEGSRLDELDHDREIFCQWTPAIYNWHNQRFSTSSWAHIMTNHLQMYEALTDDDAWSIVPLSWGMQLAQAHSLHFYRIKNPPPHRVIYAVVKVLSPNPLIDQFLNDLREEIAHHLEESALPRLSGEIEAPPRFF